AVSRDFWRKRSHFSVTSLSHSFGLPIRHRAKNEKSYYFGFFSRFSLEIARWNESVSFVASQVRSAAHSFGRDRFFDPILIEGAHDAMQFRNKATVASQIVASEPDEPISKRDNPEWPIGIKDFRPARDGVGQRTNPGRARERGPCYGIRETI